MASERKEKEQIRLLLEEERAAAKVERQKVTDQLTAQVREAGHGVVVVTSDKDLAQLVEADVEMFDFAKGKRYGPEEVREKFVSYSIEVRTWLHTKEAAARVRNASFGEDDFDLLSLVDWVLFECRNAQPRIVEPSTTRFPAAADARDQRKCFTLHRACSAAVQSECIRQSQAGSPEPQPTLTAA